MAGLAGKALRWTALAAVASSSCFAWRAAAQESEGVDFQEGAAAAMLRGRQEKKVTAVFFHMPSCQWCRKMMAGTFTDSRVTVLAGKFSWAKVDVDARPDLAASHGVTGVPYLVLFNVEGQVLSVKAGYTAPEDMTKYLTEWADKAEAPGAGVALPVAARMLKTKVEAATQASDLKAALAEPVDLLSRAGRGDRTVMLEQIKLLGPPLWEPLETYLADDRLSARAAAGDALAFATGADLPFDPFLDPEARAAQAQAWRAWIAWNKARPTSRPATASAPATDAEKQRGEK